MARPVAPGAGVPRMNRPRLDLQVTLPEWVPAAVDWDRPLPADEDRMRLAIALARENVAHRTGGPFGAAVFDERSGLPVAVGVNLVERLANAVLHAEVVALMLAQAAVGRFTLGSDDLPPYALVTSCDPCAMCLGATLWSGVRRLVCGAARDDAMGIGFEEGPVFAESYRYLTERGVRVTHGVLRQEAAAVMRAYHRAGRTIYNG
jgi:tRNA(Arg) A34 adenosine deaminase TadA